MTKLVLLHKADSIYDDEPDVVYDFPRSYLKAVQEAVGDWVIYYEPVKAGPRGYFAVAKIEQVIPKPGVERRFLAMIEPGSFLPFDTAVPRLIDGSPLERALTEPDGTPKKGGAVQLAVRRLPDEDFARIVRLGLPDDLERQEARGNTIRSKGGRGGRGLSDLRATSSGASHTASIPGCRVPPEGARGLQLPLCDVRADAPKRRRAAGSASRPYPTCRT